MKRVNFTLDEKSIKDLEKQARQEGRSKSSQVRELIKKEAQK